MRTSLGIWAMGAMVTRLHPSAYTRQLTARSTAEHVHAAVGGLVYAALGA